LQKVIPNWSAETDRDVTNFAIETLGYTPAELTRIAQAGDVRTVKALWMAQQHAKLQKATADGRVKPAPTVKPGSSNPMPQAVKDQFALKKTLSNTKLTSGQKAKAIEAELMKRF
jgi:hypothetical protein